MDSSTTWVMAGMELGMDMEWVQVEGMAQVVGVEVGAIMGMEEEWGLGGECTLSLSKVGVRARGG